MNDNDEIKTEEQTPSTVDEQPFDLDTYRNNLTQEPEQDTQIQELQSFIKEQNQAINTLRSEITELKKVNFALANRSTVDDKPQQSVESILNDVFYGKEKL